MPGGRYDRSSEFSLDTGALSQALKPKKRPALREDPLEKMLRIGSALAPAAGMAIGGLAGGGVPGAMIGGGVGTAVGGAGNLGADMMGEGRMAEEERRRREDEEQAAQSNAALRMIQGM